VPIVESPTWGEKPSMTLLGGSNAGLATPSAPFIPAGGRSVTMVGDGLRTVSYATIYRTQPAIGTAARRYAEAIARLPLQTFRFLDPAGDTRERDRAHPAHRLVSRPRPRQRGFHLRWDIALSLVVHGNYVAWKRRPRAGQPPSELWTLDWRLLIPQMVGDRVVGWQWLGDGVPGLERGETILLENTVHLGWAAPGGGELGISPLEQLGVVIRSEDALQRYAESAMRHGTRFGMAAILDKNVKADRAARDGVRDELMDVHGGVDHAFKPAILGGGVVDLKPLAEQTAVEAELIAQRRVNREEAFGLIGIPQPIAGLLEDSNYSALSELHRMLYVTLLPGSLGLIGESLQAQVIDAEPAWGDDASDALAGRFYEFSLDTVLKGDAKQRWETYAVALDHGGMTLNDVRRAENLKPYADPRADEPLIAANNVRPLSAVGTGPTGNGSPGRRVTDGAGAEVLELVHAATARALDRAARAAGAEGDVLAALDAPRVERELRADLEGAGYAAASVPRIVAEQLAADLADAHTLEDVRAVLADHVPADDQEPDA
jgi:HK97 family phage portal protein